MKKVICVVLMLSIVLCISGCSANVSTLIEEGKYEEALVIIEENPDKYSDVYDEVRYRVAEIALENNEFEKAISLLVNNGNENASTLLAHVYDLKTACEIETYFNEMLKEIDEYNPDNWTPNFDYMDGSDFYLRISDMLNDTYDVIVRDNNVDNAQVRFVEIFGYEATSVAQAKNDINELKEQLGFEEFYDSEFCYYYSLHFLMEDILKNSDNVRFEMTDTRGFAIIEHPYLLLNEKGISAKVFAYLLGTCDNFGGEISRDGERIVITFENTEFGEYFSRGYYYCAPSTQHDKMFDFYDGLSIDYYDAYIDEDGLGVTVEFINEKQSDIKYMSINLILRDKDGNHIQCTSKLIKNTDDKNIIFEAFFDGVTFDDLPGTTYSIYYFVASVMN